MRLRDVRAVDVRAGPDVGDLRRAGGHAGGVLRRVFEIEIILRRVLAEDERGAVPARCVVAGRDDALVADLGKIAPERADENEAVFEEVEVAGGLDEFVFPETVAVVVLTPGVEHPGGRDGFGGPGDGIDEFHGRRGGRVVAVGLVEIEAGVETVFAVFEIIDPAAGVGRAAFQREQQREGAGLRLLLGETGHAAELKFTEARVFDVDGLGADVLQVVGAEVLILHELHVSVFEIRIGRAGTGERRVDVDVDVLPAPAGETGLAVDVALVDVAGDLEKKVVAEFVVGGEREIFAELGEGGEFVGPNRRGLAGRHAEKRRARKRAGVAVSGDAKVVVDHRLIVDREAGRADRDAVDLIGERQGGALGGTLRDVAVFEIHDIAAEGLVAYPTRPGAHDPGGRDLGVGGQRRRHRREGRAAIPSGDAVAERGRAAQLAALAVFSLGAKRQARRGLERGGEVRAVAVFPLVVAPRVGLVPHDVGTERELRIQRLIHVGGEAVAFEAAELHARALETLRGVGLLGHRVDGAADAAGAVEDGVGPAAVIHAVEVVAVGRGDVGEKITRRQTGRNAARAQAAVADGGAEGAVGAVGIDDRAVDGPLRGLGDIGEIKGFEEFRGNDRVSDGRIFQCGGDATAGQRARGDETHVFLRAHIERRQRDGFAAGLRLGRPRGLGSNDRGAQYGESG